MDLRIFPPEEIIDCAINLPLSKSMAVRAIVLNYLSGMPVDDELCDACGDTQTLARALGELTAPDIRIDIGDAGTAMRFLTAIIAATDACHCLLTGSPRMQQRPIAPLVEALRSLGADIRYAGVEGFPPLEIHGRKLAGGEVEVDASQSSQFASALLLAAPLMDSGMTVKLRGHARSLPYFYLTAKMLLESGCTGDYDRDGARISGRPSQGVDKVERDWSAAAFWYEIAALSGGWITLPGMNPDSPQPDSAEVPLFECLGTVTEFSDGAAALSATPDLYNRLDADLSDMPDSAPALVVTATLAGIPFKLTGLSSLHDKECDRMQALIDELLKIGAVLETADYGDSIVWDGRRVPITELPVFDSHNDHRMAMALAPTAIFIPGIVVRDAECVSKSYPAFWDDMRSAGFTIEDAAAQADQQ